jgi:hypothetical protein
MVSDEAERERARREADEKERIEKAYRDAAAEAERRRLEEAERARKSRDDDDPFRTEQREIK